MKKFALFFLVISAISQTVAQNDFYWYKNARQQLVLDKHRQYFTVKSMSDADSIKKYRLGDTPRSGTSLAVVTAKGSATLNLQSLGSGQYIVQLISSGEVLDAKPLVVE